MLAPGIALQKTPPFDQAAYVGYIPLQSKMAGHCHLVMEFYEDPDYYGNLGSFLF
jgi:hypothetical protein